MVLTRCFQHVSNEVLVAACHFDISLLHLFHIRYEHSKFLRQFGVLMRQVDPASNPSEYRRKLVGPDLSLKDTNEQLLEVELLSGCFRLVSKRISSQMPHLSLRLFWVVPASVQVSPIIFSYNTLRTIRFPGMRWRKTRSIVLDPHWIRFAFGKAEQNGIVTFTG